MESKKKREISSSDSETSDFEVSDSESEKEEIRELVIFKNLPVVNQKIYNGYILINDITRLKKSSRSWSQYIKKKRTKELLKVLSREVNLNIEELIGQNQKKRWVHPYLAYDFANWMSPDISFRISRFLDNYIRNINLEINTKRNIIEIQNIELKKENTELKKENKRLNERIASLTNNNNFRVHNNRLIIDRFIRYVEKNGIFTFYFRKK